MLKKEAYAWYMAVTRGEDSMECMCEMDEFADKAEKDPSIVRHILPLIKEDLKGKDDDSAGMAALLAGKIGERNPGLVRDVVDLMWEHMPGDNSFAQYMSVSGLHDIMRAAFREI